LLSAFPTHPAHGLPAATPLPLPLPADPPVLVASYGPDAFAPRPADALPDAPTPSEPEAEADTLAVCEVDVVDDGWVSASAHAGPASITTAATNPTYRIGLGRTRAREGIAEAPSAARPPAETARGDVDGAAPTGWARLPFRRSKIGVPSPYPCTNRLITRSRDHLPEHSVEGSDRMPTTS
jgi:hypothetical protein